MNAGIARGDANSSVDCFNTLTLIFPPLHYRCLQEQKSEF